jgi:spore germination cell wall hydrolase CwlJ-like protein
LFPTKTPQMKPNLTDAMVFVHHRTRNELSSRVTTRQRRSHKQQPKPQRHHVTLLSALLVGAALLSLVAGLTYRIGQMHKRLEAVQSKLHRVSAAAIQAKARETESRKAALNLGNELEAARRSSYLAEADAAAVKKQMTYLKSELDQINVSRDLLQAELNSAFYEVRQLRTRLRAAESHDEERQLRLKAVQSDLEASEHAAIQAKKKAIELGEQAIHLQSELKMNKTELDELRKKLNEAQILLEAKPSPSKRRYTKLKNEFEARDYLIRTIVFEGEGETEMGKAALVHVILNRQRTGRWGDKIKDVVLRPWQFEPWMTRRGEIEKLSPDDPRYQDAAKIVDSVLAGRIPDPTAGATHFLNPVIVRQRRGGSLPLWADGEGRPIGRHVFYSKDEETGRAGSRQPRPEKTRYRTSVSIGAG